MKFESTEFCSGVKVNGMQELFTRYHHVGFRLGYTIRFDRFIVFGEGARHNIRVPSSFFEEIRNRFRGATIALGASRTSPAPGSLGNWIKSEHPSYHIATSYIGAILAYEGMAIWVDDNTLKFNS